MRYEAPNSVEAAVKLLASEAGMARVLAGGTDLLVQLRSGRAEPDLVVDVKRIAAMKAISAEAGGFRIGAAVSGAEMGEHAALGKLWPGVVEAARLIGSTQVQGRATMVDIPVEEVAVSPGKTSLAKGELIESVFLPARPAHSGDAYLRFIPRSEMDIAVVGAGVNVTLDAGGVCRAARVSLGAVAAKVLLVEEAAQALIGTKIDEAALAKLAAAASAACRPIDDKRGTKEFRIQVAGVLARRAAEIALQRARGK